MTSKKWGVFVTVPVTVSVVWYIRYTPNGKFGDDRTDRHKLGWMCSRHSVTNSEFYTIKYCTG